MPSSRWTARMVRLSSSRILASERTEGLVEQQHLRLVGERARHRDALLLAAGELPRQALVHAFRARRA
jgi:hypothetical protein